MFVFGDGGKRGLCSSCSCSCSLIMVLCFGVSFNLCEMCNLCRWTVLFIFELF